MKPELYIWGWTSQGEECPRQHWNRTKDTANHTIEQIIAIYQTRYVGCVRVCLDIAL